MPKSVNLSKAHAIHAIQVYHALKVTVSSDISISRIGEQCLIYGIHFTVGKNPPKTSKNLHPEESKMEITETPHPNHLFFIQRSENFKLCHVACMF